MAVVNALYELPGGCARPAETELEVFQEKSRTVLGPGLPEYWQVRWIGLDEASTEQVIELISSGDKTGTFSLPWLIEAAGLPESAVGDVIILIDFHGRPRLVVRLTDIRTVEFGAISAQDTAIDGTPVRDLDIWIPLHTNYWNACLAPFALSVSPAMPVLVESFELLLAD